MSMSVKVNGCSVSVNNEKMFISGKNYLEKRTISKMEIRLEQIKVCTKKLLKKVKQVDQLNCLKSCSVAKKKKTHDEKLNKFESKYEYLESIYNLYKISKKSDRKRNSEKDYLCQPIASENKLKKFSSKDLAKEVTLLEQEINSILRLSDQPIKKSMKSNVHNEFLKNDKSIHPSQYESRNEYETSEDIPKIILKLMKLKKKLTKKYNYVILGDDDIVESLIDEETKRDTQLQSSEIDSSFSSENKTNNNKGFVPLLADIPKTRPRISKSISTFFGKKPPASLITRHFDRLHFDSPIHELSTIDETFSADESRISSKIRRN